MFSSRLRLGALPVLTALVVSLFPAVPVQAALSPALTSLQKKGVITGYADGSLGEKRLVSRAEFLKMVLTAQKADTATFASDCFSDVKKADWFSRYVCYAKAKGFIGGYAGNIFKPNQTVSFAEAGKILSLAYKQNPQAQTADWYEPYARSLEASKAIPTNISKLDMPLTRADTAEMLWRVSEGKTDQPSKGYLNVKYPEVKINLASDTVLHPTSCKDLQAFIQESSQTTSVDYYYRNGGVMPQEGAAAPMVKDATLSNSTTGGGSDDHSVTNVQVQGVDEADIVKTDGKYLYIVDRQGGKQIRIVAVDANGSLTLASTLDFSSDQFNPTELYIQGDTLVAIGSLWTPIMYNSDTVNFGAKMIAPGGMPYGGSQKLQVRLYNVSNRNKPSLTRTLSFDGREVSSRMIGGKVYLVLNQALRWWGGPIRPLSSAQDNSQLPQYSDSALKITDKPLVNCGDVVIIPHIPSPQYLTVLAIPTSSPTAAIGKEVVLGDAQSIYMSLKNLYVAAPLYRYSWDGSGDGGTTTNLYRFALTDDGIALKAQGSVPGRILNQFSMDESNDTFRIATTIDSVWTPMAETASSNSLYVLNESLERVGTLENIAKGERIYSVRFMGKRAYMVTFKTVDPLFVIDLADGRNPKILGELKIPGYSDYLHPYDETHLIGFGKEVDPSIDADKVHSNNAVYYTAILGMKISLFDVSDVSRPKEMFKEVIGDRGTESPVLTDHKALLFEKDKGLLSFPVNVYKKSTSSPTADPQPAFQGAYVYDVSLTKGFMLRGTISHAQPKVTGTDAWYPFSNALERIVRIGTNLYTLSADQVQSHTLSDLKAVGALSFSASK
ncbi:MAG: beta-propeller domain-containing protein [Candidatus Peribacteraceae bacterium]|nr:beta-propeller domain-containing protein [Candidatus Peribacteraceae bacterium]